MRYYASDGSFHGVVTCREEVLITERLALRSSEARVKELEGSLRVSEGERIILLEENAQLLEEAKALQGLLQAAGDSGTILH
jgi:hypothetical protein